MRVALVVVTLLVVTTPSFASESCQSMAEARQHFPDSHLYWHGRHCWDANPGRGVRVHSVQRRMPIRQVQEPAQEQVQEQVQAKADQPKIDQSGWREAMSEMLPIDGAALELGLSPEVRPGGNGDAADTAWADRWVEIASSSFPFVSRWVDIAQVPTASVVPSSVAEEASADLLITPRGVIAVCIVFWLGFGTVMVLFGGTLRMWRSGSR
jgi:hypothetical protein